MRYERVKITRDERTVYNRAALPWEVPVLEFMFGEGNLVHTGAFEQNDVPYPDAKEEFHRLMSAYGSDPENGIAHVASVYGQAGQGHRALARAIREAEETDREEALPRQTRAQVIREYAADPILG